MLQLLLGQPAEMAVHETRGFWRESLIVTEDDCRELCGLKCVHPMGQEVVKPVVKGSLVDA